MGHRPPENIVRRESWKEVDERGRMALSVEETVFHQEQLRVQRLYDVRTLIRGWEALRPASFFDFNRKKKLRRAIAILRYLEDQLRGDNNQELIEEAINDLRKINIGLFMPNSPKRTS